MFHEAIDLRAFAGKEWDDKRYHLYVLLIEEALSSVAIRVPPSQIDNIQALLAAWRSA